MYWWFDLQNRKEDEVLFKSTNLSFWKNWGKKVLKYRKCHTW